MAELTDKPHRRYELDWLRVLVILNLIPFHAAWMMTLVSGFSQIPQDSFWALMLRYYVGFPSCWQMPLLFFIAGAAARISLQSRSVKQYFRERVKRLLIPLLFYMIFLGPVLFYFWPGQERSGGLSNYFLNYWPKYLLSVHALPNENTTNTSPGWHHLWFVAYLFIFSLITLPLVLHLNKKSETIAEKKSMAFLRKRFGLILLAIPLVIICAGLAPVWPFYQNNLHTDWAYFSYNLTLYIYGLIFCVSKDFWNIIDRYKRIFFLLGILFFIPVVVMWQHIPEYSTPAYTLGFMLFAFLFGLNTWFWIVALLGFARKYLYGTNDFLRYFNRASYPVYIIHLIIMAVLGHFIVQWRLGAVFEFVVFSTLSFTAIILMYEILVRRTRVTRFLFGMKA